MPVLRGPEGGRHKKYMKCCKQLQQSGARETFKIKRRVNYNFKDEASFIKYKQDKWSHFDVLFDIAMCKCFIYVKHTANKFAVLDREMCLSKS